MGIDADTAEAIAAAVARILREQEIAGMTPQEHRAHHEALARLIEREDRRAKLYARVQASAAGWIVITVIGGIGYAVWEFIKSSLR